MTDQAIVVERFKENYRKEYGIEYLDDKKDYIIAVQMLKMLPLEELLSLVDTLFDCDDNFITNAPKTIGFLRRQINQIRQLKAKSQPRVMEPMV